MADFEEQRKLEMCPGCKEEVDAEVCYCGVDLKSHDAWEEGHNFVAMGCQCWRQIMETRTAKALEDEDEQ